jgi:hypothetical protein
MLLVCPRRKTRPLLARTDVDLVDVKSFMHEKKVPNQVTVAVKDISHTGNSTLLPEFEYMKTLVPQEEWKNIKITMASPSW